MGVRRLHRTRHQAIISRSSAEHQEIIKHSSGNHQAVIRRSSGGHQVIIRHRVSCCGMGVLHGHSVDTIGLGGMRWRMAESMPRGIT
eukprot:739232-Prymnesium_polylepis.2